MNSSPVKKGQKWFFCLFFNFWIWEMKKREVWTFLIYVIRCMTVHPNERGCQFFVDLIFSIAGEGIKVWFVHSTHVNKVPRMCLALGISTRKGRALLSWSWRCNGKTGPEQWHHGGCWRAGAACTKWGEHVRPTVCLGKSGAWDETWRELRALPNWMRAGIRQP